MSIPTSLSSLTRLAQTLDADLGEVDALPTGESASLVRVARNGEVAVRSLDGDHPYDALLGFVAPDDWEVFGVIAPGWGTYYDGPRNGERRRCRAIHLAQRSGDEVSVLRFSGDGDGTVMHEPQAPGRVADCVRRALGLATPAPDEDALVAYWANAVFQAVVSSDGDVDVAAVVSPLPHSWDDARWAAITAGGNEVMDATVATWMDAGMFAREMLAAMPDPSETMAAAKRRCSPSVWQELLLVLVSTSER